MKGTTAIGARVLQTAFVLWAVVTILFLLFRLMPGSPLAAYIDPNFTPEQQAELMARFGLDESLWQQYLIYIANLLQGDLGESFFYRQPVAERVIALLPNTLILTFTSLIIAMSLEFWLAPIWRGNEARWSNRSQCRWC
jgi:peptide/nickel transport system permease protein